MPAVLADPSQAYRRCARRLRGRLGGKPGELYRSLRDLSDRFDSQFPQSTDKTRLHPPEQPLAAEFAARVERQVAAGVLSYSARLGLIEAAADIGIGRFEANLIIAAIQHRCGSSVSLSEPDFRPLSKGVVVLTAAILQASILAGAWFVLVR